ncbi:MAG: hypothetical protein IJY14_02495 [Acholeplasmatales bacterium]|nr:hypothetical protein [Acholeplasmatales bacterium]
MVKYKLFSKAHKNINKIIKEEADEIVEGVTNSYYEKRIVSTGKVTYIYIIEKYLFRINSNLSITIILEESEDGSFVEIIASGGKVGLTNVSFGAEEASVKDILFELKELGYKIVE